MVFRRDKRFAALLAKDLARFDIFNKDKLTNVSRGPT